MKTLLLNPPSFEMFDGGASSRYQATREIPSFWYPVWLAYSAGMIKDSRLLDAPSHSVSPEETIKIATEYEFLVLFTSTAGFKSDAKLAEAIKAANPTIRIAFVGRVRGESGDPEDREHAAVSHLLALCGQQAHRRALLPDVLVALWP